MAKLGDAPCKDCPNRQLRCHATCEKYKAYEEDSKKRLAENQLRHSVDGYFVNKIFTFRNN